MSRRHSRGFALVITLVLLALLVMAVLALSVLSKIGSEMSAASLQQVQARQNVLLALSVAVGELQRHAGDDTRLTGMAGIAGVAGTRDATTRHWCGVWRDDGSFVTWLTSGALGATDAGPDTIELIGQGTVGAASSTSANVEKQHVIAGKIPIMVPDAPGAPGVPVKVGSYAYLVTDEGIKLGAYAPPEQRAVSETVPAIGSSMLTNQLRLRTALETNAAVLPALLSYEQMGLLPAVTPSVLQDCFHYVTLTPRTVAGAHYRTGMINLNTSSALVWRSLLDTYNTMPGVTPVPDVTARGSRLGNDFAAATAGKAANGPFISIAAFETYLATVFPDTGSPDFAQIMAALGPMLTVRSDTFRIRAYGEVLNPADAARTEAAAYGEAIVQRTPDPMPGFGRRFVITAFRWLGPEDI